MSGLETGSPLISHRDYGKHLMASVKGKRDRALLAVMLACGVRRHEAVDLEVEHIQQREEHWAIVDLKGKGGHMRTIPMPSWVKQILDDWVNAANVRSGKLFRRVNRTGKAWGDNITEKAVWHIVREHAAKAGIDKWHHMTFAGRVPGYVMRREENSNRSSFCLGVSIQTTERYLGCKQRIRSAVNDRIGIEPV